MGIKHHKFHEENNSLPFGAIIYNLVKIHGLGMCPEIIKCYEQVIKCKESKYFKNAMEFCSHYIFRYPNRKEKAVLLLKVLSIEIKAIIVHVNNKQIRENDVSRKFNSYESVDEYVTHLGEEYFEEYNTGIIETKFKECPADSMEIYHCKDGDMYKVPLPFE